MTVNEKIRKFDADIFGFCRACAVMNLTMDATLSGMEEQGFSREELLDRHGAVWMAAHFKYNVSRPLFVDEELEIEMGPLKVDGAHVMSELFVSADGSRVGRAVGAWIIADAVERRIIRPRTLPGLEKAENAKKGEFLRRILPPEGADESLRAVRYSDCDVNGHFNSPRYADCICDAHRLDELAPAYVSEMQISFSAESKPGDELKIKTWREEEKFMTHASCGGLTRFTSYFKLAEHEKVR